MTKQIRRATKRSGAVSAISETLVDFAKDKHGHVMTPDAIRQRLGTEIARAAAEAGADVSKMKSLSTILDAVIQPKGSADPNKARRLSLQAQMKTLRAELKELSKK